MPMASVYASTWAPHHGKRVMIDGRAHVLRVETWTAKYPYRHEAIHVSAAPVDRESAWYRQVREQLGDDWSTDVLASDVELQASILEQLL